MGRPTEFDLRLAQIRNIEQSNCIGTALYLTEEQDEDLRVNTFGVYCKHLDKLISLDYPVRGCLVAWQKQMITYDEPITKVPHLGVITRTNPMLVTNRFSVNGPIRENQPIAQISADEDYVNCTIHYYLPRALEKRLAI